MVGEVSHLPLPNKKIVQSSVEGHLSCFPYLGHLEYKMRYIVYNGILLSIPLILNLILLSHKKDEILTFVTTWMDFENIMLSTISQLEKVKNHMISLICGI